MNFAAGPAGKRPPPPPPPAADDENEENANENDFAVAAGGFPVDDCFGRGVGRMPLDGLALGAEGRAAGEQEITFEEFIRGGRSKKRGGALDPESGSSHNYFLWQTSRN
jgi:hypothetical protein